MAGNNKFKTIFQSLDKAISGGWNENKPVNKVNSYNLDGKNNDIVYRTNSKADLERKKLELQQQKLITSAWKKANAELSLESLAGLSNVKIMYRDADLMDAYPEIGAALDMYAEEACTLNDKNKMVNVSSSSDRIKNAIEDLLVNRLDIHVTLPMICRATCKYGNNFQLLNINEKKGIIGWRQLPVYEIDRYENGLSNPYTYITGNVTTENDETRFVWLGKNEQNPYRNWQVGHFRLLTDSLYLPYGVSALNKARRHWRMLALMEDMMLIYRLERSIERRVFKIYVGNIDDDDVEAYVNDIANNFKRSTLVDPQTGQLDLRKNILPVWKNTPIPLLDGRIITIEELANEFANGKENYVYSIQDNTLQIVPGKVIWCGKNYFSEKMVKVWLDDDTFICTAPEHPFVMRDGSSKRADELTVGEFVMPFYRESIYSSPKNHNVKKIEWVDGDDVYCMTIVGENDEDDRHNFAALTYDKNMVMSNSGCFVRNSVDQDFFIPVRSEDAPNPIDTLGAAQNLTAMDDIKYVQNKILAGLRIPKTFLNFEEATGDGKNLALMDIRFTRTINRIQQALLMELNKIVTIHLFILGFTDDLTNFTLTMNNPSSQADMLEIENLQKKINTVKEAVTDPGNGIPIMSMRRALKTIMHWDDSEIIENLNEIRLEKALSSELEKTSQIIKRTGQFDQVDRIYGEPGAQYQEGGDGSSEGGGDSGFSGGAGFGDDLGSDVDSLGDIGEEPEGEIGGEEGEASIDSALNDENAGQEDNATPIPENESVFNKLNKKLITEKEILKKKYDKKCNYYTSMYMKKLQESKTKKEGRIPLLDKAFLVNEEINSMVGKLSKYLND